MFTGIITAVGKIEKIEPRGGDWRLTINTANLDLSDVALGDSIATSGVCLTAIELGAQSFVADVSAETLKVSTLGGLSVGSRVNLEKALRLQDRLGGHLVSGHVDGIGKILQIDQEARSVRYLVEAPQDLARFIAHKGSITINGVSLTVNQVDGLKFDVNIVPHTIAHTTIDEFQIGTEVNLEVDMLARYLERLMTGPKPEVDPINIDFLTDNGFI